MLYSGHFSFDEITPHGTKRHGYFTCLVKAGTPELALQNFKQRIQIIKEDIKDPLFKYIQVVYVEDIIEIADSPEEAVVTWFQSSDGPFPESGSSSLPLSDTTDITVYQWVPGSAFSTDQKETNGEYKEAPPFLRFST